MKMKMKIKIKMKTKIKIKVKEWRIKLAGKRENNLIIKSRNVCDDEVWKVK